VFLPIVTKIPDFIEAGGVSDIKELMSAFLEDIELVGRSLDFFDVIAKHGRVLSATSLSIRHLSVSLLHFMITIM
jgi:hypothetical protein